VTNQEKQEESSAEALEMVEVGRFENEASEQEQRSVEEKQTMFVAADSNDSAVLTESRDTSEALPVTIQEKEEESSAEPLMTEVASFENEASEQEQRSVEEKQTMFVGADSNDLAVLTEGRDTSESFPFTNQETQEESSPEALEMLEDDRAESEIIQQEKRYLEEKQPIFFAADSNDSAVLMESLENSKPCLATNQEKQEESSAGTLEMLEDARFETEVNEQEKRSAEQPMSSDTNDATVLVESIDNAEAFPETNQEKQEESSAEVAADVLPSFQTSHVPAMQDSSVCPAKGLVTDDGVGEEVHPITSCGPVVPSGVTPENEAEELDNKEYSVSGYSTELFEELAKSEGFDRVNGMDEQGQMLASDEASQLYSQLQTRHVLSIQDSSFDQAEETVSDENAGEVVDPDSRHSLKGASPIITGGNEQEKRSGEADRSFDGNIDVGSVPGTLNYC
jgi:cephalosporin hydroxylase